MTPFTKHGIIFIFTLFHLFLRWLSTSCYTLELLWFFRLVIITAMQLRPPGTLLPMAPLVGAPTPQARSAPAVAFFAVLRIHLPSETRRAPRLSARCAGRSTTSCRWLHSLREGGYFCIADLLYAIVVQISFTMEAGLASAAVQANQSIALYSLCKP